MTEFERLVFQIALQAMQSDGSKNATFGLIRQKDRWDLIKKIQHALSEDVSFPGHSSIQENNPNKIEELEERIKDIERILHLRDYRDY